MNYIPNLDIPITFMEKLFFVLQKLNLCGRLLEHMNCINRAPSVVHPAKATVSYFSTTANKNHSSQPNSQRSHNFHLSQNSKPWKGCFWTPNSHWLKSSPIPFPPSTAMTNQITSNLHIMNTISSTYHFSSHMYQFSQPENVDRTFLQNVRIKHPTQYSNSKWNHQMKVLREHLFETLIVGGSFLILWLWH